MNGKYLLLKKAQIEYNAAITDPTTPTLESLQALVKQAQVAVEKNEIILKEKENLLALAEDFDAAEWDAKSLEMKKKMSEYQSLQDKAEVEKIKIEKSADYKAAVQNVTDKEELLKRYILMIQLLLMRVQRQILLQLLRLTVLLKNINQSLLIMD